MITGRKVDRQIAKMAKTFDVRTIRLPEEIIAPEMGRDEWKLRNGPANPMRGYEVPGVRFLAWRPAGSQGLWTIAFHAHGELRPAEDVLSRVRSEPWCIFSTFVTFVSEKEAGEFSLYLSALSPIPWPHV